MTEQQPIWQVRQKAIRLYREYGLTPAAIARLLELDIRLVVYWLDLHLHTVRQGDVY